MAKSDYSSSSPRATNRTALVVVSVLALLGLAYALLRVDILRARIATLQTDTHVLQDNNAQLRTQLDELLKTQQITRTQLSQLQTELGVVHEQLGGLREGVTTAKQQWAKIEAVHLLRLAQDQLQLGHDPASAIQTLTAALTALGNDKETSAIQQQVSQHLQQLNALPFALYAHTQQQLAQAAQQIPQLPLRQQSSGNQDDGEPLPESGIDLAWVKFRRALSSLINVHTDTTPALSSGAQLLGQTQLQTLLTQAALAIRAQDQPTYIAMLNQAQSTLPVVLDTQHAAVKNLQRLLQQLAQLNIAPALPDLDNSIRALERGLPAATYGQSQQKP